MTCRRVPTKEKKRDRKVKTQKTEIVYHAGRELLTRNNKTSRNWQAA
jgi:hypothetical protein